MKLAEGYRYLSDAMVANISTGTAFPVSDDSPHVFAYKTRGGSYMIASSGRQLDGGKPRDSVVITFSGNVVPMNPFVSPEFAEEVEKALGADDKH